ncbi:MAG: hypothetical protein VR65_27385 [Desulfobulbaceae bacterium BRH_c16a]|nr:MAG: hypothetical protein VR65_27385 [Desulfobulbaceae bacterium BRH_c16a]
MVVLLAIALLVSGCTRTQPVSYYQLSAVDSGRPAIDTSAIGEAVIGIGPLLLPEYLDRPQIVNREGPNLMQLAETNRWAEPLAVSIPRAMRENLAAALATESIVYYPWSQAVDYQIIIEIIRFEGEESREAHLEAVWSMQDREGNIVLPQQRSKYQVRATPADSEGLVQALSQALGRLSREIAEKLSEKR